MNRTNISWATHIWNPVSGCTKVSPGCKNCYAEVLAGRLQAMGNARYGAGFNVTLHPDLLRRPLTVKAPARVFVCSMADLFHDEVPDEYIWSVFKTMIEARHHTFMVLTKRAERMMMLVGRMCSVQAPPNIWLGVSIEDQTRSHERLPKLIATPAALRFVSVEPQLEYVDLKWPLRRATGQPAGSRLPHGLGWVICGGESGAGRRPFDKVWAREIRDDCREAGVPFFFKQGSAFAPGRDDILDGEILHEFPIPAAAR